MQNTENKGLKSGEYVFDSYALLAFLEDEPGSNRVLEMLEAAKNRKCNISMCVINLGEVLYIVERERGLVKAQETLARIMEFPLEIVEADLTLTKAAAHLKANNSIAYADCFSAALSQVKDASLVTGDPEFYKINTGTNLHIELLDNNKKQNN
jgi:predicted nucleic acid-binding protein